MQIKTCVDKLNTLSHIQCLLSKIMFAHNNKWLQLKSKWWCSNIWEFKAFISNSTWWCNKEQWWVVKLPCLSINLICLSLCLNLCLSLWWASQVKYTGCPKIKEWFQASKWDMDSSLHSQWDMDSSNHSQWGMDSSQHSQWGMDSSLIDNIDSTTSIYVFFTLKIYKISTIESDIK